MNLRDKLKFWIALNNYIEMIVGPAIAPLRLDSAVANSLSYVKAYGGTKQGLPGNYTQVNYVTNIVQTEIDTGVVIDRSKNYTFEYRGRAVTGSWYILQARDSTGGVVYGLSGSNSNGNFILSWGGGSVTTTNILRSTQNITHTYYIRGEVDVDNGTLNLYVKDETSDAEETVTGTCTAGQGLYATVGLLGNLLGSQMVQINNYVYMARIKENGVTVMDFVPARQGTIAGFYDTVSGTFKTAAISGDLVADGDTVPTPDAPMDIVSNNGVLKYGRYGENLANEGATSWDVLGPSRRLGVSLSEGGYYSVRVRVKGTIPAGCYVGLGSVRPGESDWVVTNWLILNGSINPSYGGFYSREITGTQLGLNVYNVPDPQTFYENVEVMLVKGEYTSETMPPYEPYKFGLYADGITETIWAHGKNLWDGKMYRGQLNQGRPYISMGTEITSPITSSGAYSGVGVVVKVIPGQQYCFSSDVTNTQYRYVGFYANREDVADYTKVISFAPSTTAIAPAGANYAVFCCANAISGTEFSWTWVQAEYGSTPTDYEPYYDGGTATAEMLLSVSDHTDVQEILSGDITRKVGVMVLDGTETITTNTSVGTRYRYMIRPGNLDASPTEVCYSTHFIGGKTITQLNTDASLDNSITVYTSYIWFYTSTFATTDALKQFFTDKYNAGTPVIVVYPRAIEGIWSVAGQMLNVTSGDNVIDITQASISPLNLEAKYKKVP